MVNFAKPAHAAWARAPAAAWMLLAAAASAQPAGKPYEFGEQLTPEALVSAVLDRNPSLTEAEASAEAAAARVAPAGALADPTLSYSVAPAAIGVDDHKLGQRVELSQEVPWPGKRSLRERAARGAARAAEEASLVQRLRVIAATKAAFAEWVFVHEALRLNSAHQRLLEELRSIAERRYAAGRALRQDVLQAELAIAQLEDRAFDLEREQAAVQARLNALMNRAPDAALPAPAPLPGIGPTPRLEQLSERAAAHHPELRRLQHRIAARAAAQRLAEKEVFPDMRFSTGYYSLRDLPENRFLVGLSVNLPLDQARRRDEINAAKAERRRAEYTLIDRRNRILGALAEARAAVERQAKSVGLHRERLLPLADETLEATVSAYRSGAGDFLDVISAERSRLAIEEALARTEADHYRALAELERWTGGALPAARGEAR